MIKLKKTWRWFGENDPVTLDHLRQMEIEGVVTALYDLTPGNVWPAEQIGMLKKTIADAGLEWCVTESLPVSEGIKLHNKDYDYLVENYRESVRNLGEQGIQTICYNFMPAIDWIRTDTGYTLPSGGVVMYFNDILFTAFDLFILKRPGAENAYSTGKIEQAEKLFKKLSPEDAEAIAYNIIVRTQSFIHGESFQGNEEGYKQAFLNRLDAYRDIDSQKLRENLLKFLSDVIPVAEKYGVKLCIHPDDPPFPVLGLPRIVSTQEDLKVLFSHIPSLNNGLTFCSGSLSLREGNDLKNIAETFADRIHFIHLRNNVLFENGDFMESGHLEGRANLPALIAVLLNEQERRKKTGRTDFCIPVRPDHGIKLLDDFNRNSQPGYPLIGRYRGLLEIAGMEAGIKYMMQNQR